MRRVVCEDVATGAHGAEHSPAQRTIGQPEDEGIQQNDDHNHADPVKPRFAEAVTESVALCLFVAVLRRWLSCKFAVENVVG